jgi:hypothetical protein
MWEVAPREPIVIYRSVNREGQTFALKPSSRQFLREQLGDAVHARPRLFIAHETNADDEHLRGEIAPQVIQLLTGLTRERLDALGGVVFRDPVTDHEISAA